MRAASTWRSALLPCLESFLDQGFCACIVLSSEGQRDESRYRLCGPGIERLRPFELGPSCGDVILGKRERARLNVNSGHLRILCLELLEFAFGTRELRRISRCDKAADERETRHDVCWVVSGRLLGRPNGVIGFSGYGLQSR